MGEQMMKLPPGFRFNPKDEEIISCYLKPKFLGQTLLCDFMDTAELYGPDSTPWLMFDVNSWMDSQDNTEKYMYVFTKLSKLRTTSDCNNKKKMSSRDNTVKKAGCGTWVGKIKRKIRDSKDNVIGEKRLLGFVINDIGAGFDLDKAAYFKMHQYSLSGINKGLKAAPGLGDLVLCRITYDSSKEPVFKMASKSDAAHDPNQSSDAHDPNQSDEGQSKNENLEGSVVGVEYLAAANDQYNNGFLESNEFVGDPGFDINWLNDILSNQEDEQVEDNSNLGKRKFEEENLHGTKKMCF